MHMYFVYTYVYPLNIKKGLLSITTYLLIFLP